MWKKVIITLVLVAFASVQYGDSLICNSCNSVESCRNPGSHICSNEVANISSEYLKQIHSDVPVVNSSSFFNCANLTYYFASNNTQTAAFLGCVHPNANVCSLTLSAPNSDTWTKKCSTCNKHDYCNPAGTFSGSFFTIVASVLALVVAKLVH